MIFGEVSCGARGHAAGPEGAPEGIIMLKKLFASVFLLCLALLAVTVFAQDTKIDTKTVLAAAEKAMGGADLKSIQYSGTGFTAALGQSVNPASPWPRFDLRAYTRTINYTDGSSKEELTRVQG